MDLDLKLKELLKSGSILKTQVSKKGEDMKGKFGRILGDFILEDGSKVTEVLINTGHAVAYFGGSKDDVDAAHLVNRERLINEGVVTI